MFQPSRLYSEASNPSGLRIAVVVALILLWAGAREVLAAPTGLATDDIVAR